MSKLVGKAVIGFLLMLLCTSDVLSDERIFQFYSYGAQDGLPHGTISAIHQDRYGFIWVGTYDGLARFDGYRFKKFAHDAEDTRSISGNNIQVISEIDHEGKPLLLIGTKSHGLSIMDIERESFQSFLHIPGDSATISHNYISTILPLSVQSIYIGTNGGGLNRLNLDDGTIESWFSHQLATIHTLRTYSQEHSEELIVGTEQGLFRIDINGLISTHQMSPEISGRIQNIYVSTDGTIWLAAWRHGLVRLDPVSGDTRIWSDELGIEDEKTPTIMTIGDAGSGALWLGTFGSGLKLFDPASGKIHSWESRRENPSGLAHNSVTRIFRDEGGVTWAGTFSGLNRVVEIPGRFEVVRHDSLNPNSLDNSFVWSIVEDNQQDLWIGTSTGLNHIDATTQKIQSWNHLPNAKPGTFVANAVLTILPTSDRELWLGTFGAGLMRFNIGTQVFDQWRIGTTENKVSLNMVYKLIADESGMLWLATEGGLCLFDPEAESVHLPPQSEVTPVPEANAHINTITRDQDGDIWIGTLENGLTRWEPRTRKYTRFVHDPENTTSLSGNSVTAIVPEQTGEGKLVWVGTESTGLNLLSIGTEGSTVRRYGEAEGLTGASILEMQMDNQSRLWITTDHGVFRYDPETASFAHFDVVVDGKDFTFGSFASCKRLNGELLFGGPDGMVRFSPERIVPDERIPPVYFTDFSVFGEVLTASASSPTKRSAPMTSRLELPYTASQISLDFAALDYRAPDKNVYSYMVEGLHSDWIELGTRNSISFSSLPAGNYTVKLQGASSSGVWNYGGQKISLSIIPAVWNTWWFRLVGLAVVLGVVGFVYRSRIARLQRENVAQERFARRLIEVQDSERQRIAGELHDSVGQSLLIISNSAQLHLQHPDIAEATKTELNEITDVARETVDQVREISYNLYPHQLDRLGLDKAIDGMIKRVQTSTELKIELYAHAIDQHVSRENQIHLFRVIQEGLNNILRHAKATNATITIQDSEESILIIISDNGKGFDTSNVLSTNRPNGLGLQGMAERAKVMGGTLNITSTPGQGSTITVEIPVS